jgi:hypothetical protein
MSKKGGKMAWDSHSRESHFADHPEDKRKDLHLMPGANGQETNASTNRHPSTNNANKNRP